jgi:integrase
MARPVKHGGKWRIRWVDENGQRRSEVHDEFKIAQARLHERQVEVDEIKRGLRRPTPPDKTFSELADYWTKNRVPLKRSGKYDESIIRCHLGPAFGHLLLRSIGVAEIDAFKVAKVGLNKKTLSNILTLLISMLKAATEIHWLVAAPTVRKPKVRLFSKDYRYLRTEEEIRRFLSAASAEGANVFALYATATYTGLRAGELAALRWEDVDFERRLITVQRSWDGPTKADDVRYVPVVDVLLPLLKSWRLRVGSGLCFPNEANNMLGESAAIFQEVLHRVLNTAQFPKVFRRGKERGYIVFHDLRHTFASHWMMSGGDIFKLSKILGHKSLEMTMRYAHLAPHAFAGDFGRLGGMPGPEASLTRLESSQNPAIL